MYWVWLLPGKNSAQQFTVFQGFCQAALPPHNVREPSLGFQNLDRMARPSWHLFVRHLCTMQYWSSQPVQQEWIQVGILKYAPITLVDLSLSLFSSISSDLGRQVVILKCLGLFESHRLLFDFVVCVAKPTTEMFTYWLLPVKLILWKLFDMNWFTLDQGTIKYNRKSNNGSSTQKCLVGMGTCEFHGGKIVNCYCATKV